MSSSPPLSLSRSRGLSEKLLEADTRQCLPIAGLETPSSRATSVLEPSGATYVHGAPVPPTLWSQSVYQV